MGDTGVTRRAGRSGEFRAVNTQVSLIVSESLQNSSEGFAQYSARLPSLGRSRRNDRGFRFVQGGISLLAPAFPVTLVTALSHFPSLSRWSRPLAGGNWALAGKKTKFVCCCVLSEILMLPLISAFLQDLNDL